MSSPVSLIYSTNCERWLLWGRLLALLAAWGTDPGGPPDFDGDGEVRTTDLLAMIANWGPCPK